MSTKRKQYTELDMDLINMALYQVLLTITAKALPGQRSELETVEMLEV